MAQQTGFTAQQLTGRSNTHIIDVAVPACRLHHAVVAPFLAMREAASADGIDLLPVSSFRDFDRQLAIWNAKCRGERALLDASGQPVSAAAMEADELVRTILIWSALPGASRHHWGTDLDVVDAAAMPAGYRPQLVPDEFAAGGLFAKLDGWLAAHAEAFGFFRPYGEYRGGVQPEPWHLSHAATADEAMQQFSVEVLQQALAEAELAARDAVQRLLPEIVARYVMDVDAPRGGALSRGTRLA